MTGKRALNRQHLEAEILRLGRHQLADVGPAGLSLRAIARELGMSSSAVYRYVDSRDELLTRLIVESYDASADAVLGALEGIDETHLGERWFAIGRAMRTWGVANPYDWALLYGSPVPGYDAPGERTTDPGTRVLMLVVGLLCDIAAAGRAPRSPGGITPDDTTLAGARAQVAEFGLSDELLPADLFLAGISAWTLLIGSVSAEVFEQFGGLGATYGVLHEWNLALALGLILE